MKYPKRSQYKYAKSRYRIGNWPEYEAGLRRRGDLTVWLSEDAINSWREPLRETGKDQPIHILIDSTGLRIHVGPVRKPPKRRAWRKLHLAVDAENGEIVASDLTSRRTRDGARVCALLEQIDNQVAALSADGAYDATGVYEAAQEKGDGKRVRVLISPGRNAQLNPRPSAAQRERNQKSNHEGSTNGGIACLQNSQQNDPTRDAR